MNLVPCSEFRWNLNSDACTVANCYKFYYFFGIFFTFYFDLLMAHEENEDFPGRLLHQAALWGNAELLEDLLHGDM
ncbi:hypothetical protein TNCT_64291, partial [Trichonephila clavata]